MLVHPDQSGNHSVISEVQSLRAGWNRDFARIANGLNFSVRDEDGLILAYRRARSIDHTDMRQRDYRRAHSQERLDARLELLLG